MISLVTYKCERDLDEVSSGLARILLLIILDNCFARCIYPFTRVFALSGAMGLPVVLALPGYVHLSLDIECVKYM